MKIFTEVIVAPSATAEAMAIIAAKKNLRLLLTGGLADPKADGLTVKSLSGGLLVQTRDNRNVDDTELKVVTKKAPTESELADLRLAMKVAKHVKSNAIIYVRDGATVGIGAGQMSRVEFEPHRPPQGRGRGLRRRSSRAQPSPPTRSSRSPTASSKPPAPAPPR